MNIKTNFICAVFRNQRSRGRYARHQILPTAAYG